MNNSGNQISPILKLSYSEDEKKDIISEFINYKVLVNLDKFQDTINAIFNLVSNDSRYLRDYFLEDYGKRYNLHSDVVHMFASFESSFEQLDNSLSEVSNSLSLNSRTWIEDLTKQFKSEIPIGSFFTEFPRCGQFHNTLWLRVPREKYHDLEIPNCIPALLIAESTFESLVLNEGLKELNLAFVGSEFILDAPTTLENLYITNCNNISEFDFKAPLNVFSVSWCDWLPSPFVTSYFKIESCEINNLDLANVSGFVEVLKCNSLEILRVSPGVQRIVIDECSGLKSLIVEDGVTEVEVLNCDKLKYISLPNSVTKFIYENTPKLKMIKSTNNEFCLDNTIIGLLKNTIKRMLKWCTRQDSNL